MRAEKEVQEDDEGEGEEEEGEDEGRWDKRHSGLWAQPLPAAHNYDNSSWVLSLVRPTCSPSSFISIFLFSDSCSPVPLHTVASPTFNPLRPREVRWVQADRFAGEKLNPICIPSFLEALAIPRTDDTNREAPFRKDSNNQALCLSHEFCSVSNVLLKCVISFRYRIYEMKNFLVRYYLSFVAFINFFYFNIPWHYEIVGPNRE